MDGTEIILIFIGLIFYSTKASSSNGVSVSCMMAYDEGGAPAVFDSEDECFHIQTILSALSPPNQTATCQFFQLQGRRDYQEDRVSCDLHIKFPFLTGKDQKLKDVTVGIAAVFDGHGGDEASEMASKLLFPYFYLHYVFKMYKLTGHTNETKSLLLDVLKEALLSTIHDIDIKFTREAIKNNFYSGSTATIVVVYDEQILVANAGDSKAILFSKNIQSGMGTEAEELSVVELTKDHHPDRNDERARIEAAGGSVINWGVPRVNGVLALSRSIGDVLLKRFGVIAVPEFTDWLHITSARYLLVASDGIFESLTPTDIRNLLSEWNSHTQESFSSLAEFIVRTAYREGSTDNISAIIIPLKFNFGYF